MSVHCQFSVSVHCQFLRGPFDYSLVLIVCCCSPFLAMTKTFPVLLPNQSRAVGIHICSPLFGC